MNVFESGNKIDERDLQLLEAAGFRSCECSASLDTVVGAGTLQIQHGMSQWVLIAFGVRRLESRGGDHPSGFSASGTGLSGQLIY